jgi:uncharacterized protein YkwD
MAKQTKKPLKRVSRTTRSKTKHPKILLGRARFLPAIMIALFATVLSLQPHSALPQARGILAYATNVSNAGLLSSTNAQRSNNGVSVLSSNSLLTAAAQAKADDMVTRGYWSHNTPDGQQPWVFITNAGYQYAAAGENLAYGFMTSSDTVTGWMNSPGHRANLLSTAFVDVGFGIANSPDYCYIGDHDVNPSTPDVYGCTGQQTIVVAMYGKLLGASTPAPTQPNNQTPAPATKNQSVQTPTPTPQAPESQPAAELTTEPIAENTPSAPEVITDAPADSSLQVVQARPTTITRIQTFASNNPLLSVGAVTTLIVAIGVLWLVHKGVHIRKSIIAGERFILHHIHLDLTVLAIVYLGFVLLSSTGMVR